MYSVCVFITTRGGIRNSFHMEALVKRGIRPFYCVKAAFPGKLENAAKTFVFANSETEAIDKYLHSRLDPICDGLEIVGHTKL